MSLKFHQKINNLVESVLFELLERISTFHIHLKDIDTRFYPPRTAKDTELHFVDSFNDCLAKVLYSAITVMKAYKEDSSNNSNVSAQKSGIEKLA